MATLDVRLKRINKVYNSNELLSGIVVVQSRGEVLHQGITLTVEGMVNLQLSAKSVGMFEAFYNSIKPIQLLYCTLEIAKPGKLPSGKTEIPFEMPLKAKPHKVLHETYHGVFVNIQYSARVEMKRSLLNKDLQNQCEFIIEYKRDDIKPAECDSVNFTITPANLQNIKDKQNVPKFKVTGCLDSTKCCITKPFTGELTVNNCEWPIKSIELQLVRVETCGCAEGYAKDVTEIQNIQIADGDVCRALSLPISMIFPRLFTCPSLTTSNFKIEFEVNIVIIFQDDQLVTENFPITLSRF